MANLIWVIGASKCGKAKTIRLPAIQNFPDVIGHIPSDGRLVNGKESVPFFLEDDFESE